MKKVRDLVFNNFNFTHDDTLNIDLIENYTTDDFVSLTFDIRGAL